MPTDYINNKTSQLLKDSTDNSREMALIFGDEAKTSGSPRCVHGGLEPAPASRPEEPALIFCAPRGARTAGNCVPKPSRSVANFWLKLKRFAAPLALSLPSD
jgi:hypothetical protein